MNNNNNNNNNKANNNGNRPCEDFSFEGIRNYDTARLCICYKLLNLEQNKQLLDTRPYIPYLDLAIVFYVPYADDDGRLHEINITKAMMQSWEIDVSQLYADAHQNTVKFLPATIKSLSIILNKVSYESKAPKPDVPLYVVSNRMELYGASSILYDGLLHASADLFEDDIVVIPSSVHDMILIPASATPDPISLVRDMVVSVNQTLAAEDVLSDNIYYYSKSADSLKII